MRMPPVYNIYVISILNKVLGMNTVKASDIINIREKINAIKKLLNRVLLKKTDMKIQFRINTDKVDTIIEILYIFKTVINKDLHNKKLNCFNVEWLYAFGVCLAIATIAKSADSNKLIINSQTMINIFITP